MSFYESDSSSISHIHFDYSLHEQTLVNVQLAKYHCAPITDYIGRGQHSSEISSKPT